MIADCRRTLERAPEAQWSWLGDELVVLDPAGVKLRGLNATGARVWELMDGNRSLRAIAEQLAAEFDAPLPDIERDVLSFAQALRERGLLQERAGGDVR